MVVKIISAERETLWYADAVGSEIEVIKRIDGDYNVLDENSPQPGVNYTIKKEDCEVIEEI